MLELILVLVAGTLFISAGDFLAEKLYVRPRQIRRERAARDAALIRKSFNHAS